MQRIMLPRVVRYRSDVQREREVSIRAAWTEASPSGRSVSNLGSGSMEK